MPVILAFVNLYLPGFRGGGPARSLANLVERLGDEFDFRIVTTDRDCGDQRSYSGVTIDGWNRVGKARVFYASSNTLGWRGLRTLLRATPCDVLYLNSYFHPVFTLKPLLLQRLHQVARTPVVIAPRGEFSPGALAIKQARKRAFITLARGFGLYRGVRWQASTSDEARDIQRSLAVPASAVLEARNLVAPTPAPTALTRTADAESEGSHRPALRACFLSRVSEKKNLDFALRVLSQVKSQIDFDIYGPIEDATYWRRCQTMIAALPKNVSVHYRGPVEPAQVSTAIAAHDLFFVPTHGENFGHVFVEAWSAGVPVLVSNQTPWRDLKARGIGWDLPLGDESVFVRAIESASTWNAARVAAVRAACVAFGADQANDAAVLEANRRLFCDAMAGR